MIFWNKALWSAASSRVTPLNQSECFISPRCSCTGSRLKNWFSIQIGVRVRVDTGGEIYLDNFGNFLGFAIPWYSFGLPSLPDEMQQC